MKRLPSFISYTKYLYLVLCLLFSAVATYVLAQGKVLTPTVASSIHPLDTVALLRIIRQQQSASFLDRNLSFTELDTILYASRVAHFNTGIFFALSSLGAEHQIKGDHK